MKTWLPTVICCGLVVGCSSTKDSASGGATAPKVSEAAQAAGDYAGDWISSDGGTGKLSISLKKPDDSPWEARLSFTYEGGEVATVIKSVEINGTHVRLTDQYEAEGTKRDVELTGELAVDILQGDYKFPMGNGDPGTWKVKRAQ
jgi:hypothetical protein